MRLCQVYKAISYFVQYKYARWGLKKAEAPTLQEGRGLAITKTKENRILLIDKQLQQCFYLQYKYASSELCISRNRINLYQQVLFWEEIARLRVFARANIKARAFYLFKLRLHYANKLNWRLKEDCLRLFLRHFFFYLTQWKTNSVVPVFYFSSFIL